MYCYPYWVKLIFLNFIFNCSALSFAVLITVCGLPIPRLGWVPPTHWHPYLSLTSFRQLLTQPSPGFSLYPAPVSFWGPDLTSQIAIFDFLPTWSIGICPPCLEYAPYYPQRPHLLSNWSGDGFGLTFVPVHIPQSSQSPVALETQQVPRALVWAPFSVT